MAEVNYTASTASANGDESLEPSVEILDPRITSSSHSNDKHSEDNDEEKKVSNRPSRDAWRQQRLPAWQPILTADTVLPAFFLLAIALIPIGAGLLVSSNSVKEYVYEYTDCISTDGKTKCSDIIGKSMNGTFKFGKKKWRGNKIKCECIHNFTIDKDFDAPVFLYYGLSNYYQNHRRYAKSRDDTQLAGTQAKHIKDCHPYDYDKNKRLIAPCGAIANSLFTDTFQLYYQPTDSNYEPIDLAQTHIAWPTDKEYLFNNPKDGFDSKIGRPPLWTKNIDDLDPNHPINNGYDNEHLIVWMRTAAFPTFRKLWARIDHDQNMLWRQSLPAGSYQLRIQYNYRTHFDSYTAGKYVYISNTSWLGGKNVFLGYAYITVGTICFILWLSFLILVKKYGQKPKDIVDIGKKTKYMFTKPKPVDSGDESTQPLNANNPTVTFSQSQP